jgi:hypothetical protein
MPRVGFEPTIPMFERANTFHALDRATYVIGTSFLLGQNILFSILLCYPQCVLRLGPVMTDLKISAKALVL